MSKTANSRLRRLFLNEVTLLAFAIPCGFLIGLAVRMGRFEMVHRFLPNGPGKSQATAREVTIVQRAVRRAIRLSPSETCLSQASLGKILMNLLDRQSVLHVGVRLGEDNTVRAHAWLSVRGITMVGGPDAKIAPFRQIAEFV